MNKKLYYPVIVGVLALLVGLSVLRPPISPTIVELRPSKLAIFNNSNHTVYVAAFEHQAAPYARWKPCEYPARCSDLTIAPGRVLDLKFELIYHWYSGAKVSVLWWHLLPDDLADNGYRMDGPHEVLVTTPNRVITGS